MCTSQHAFKDTLHCAHIPLNVVPKDAQPLSPTGISGERQRQFGEKDTGVGGVEEVAKGESSPPVKDQPSV